MGFVLLAAINITIILSWDVMSYSLANEYPKFICLITAVKIRVINKSVCESKRKNL
jgi:hypothetical protein